LNLETADNRARTALLAPAGRQTALHWRATVAGRSERFTVATKSKAAAWAVQRLMIDEEPVPVESL